MPSNIVKSKQDEELWNSAKEKAKESGKNKNYAYIMKIFKTMKGESKITNKQRLSQMKNITSYQRIFKEDELIQNKNFVTKLLEILSQIRTFHWQTFSYPQHMAFGSYYDSMNGLADTFIETAFGNDGRKATVGSINLMDYEENKAISYISDTLNYLKQLRGEMNDNTDLENIVDEMIGVTNKLRYLLTLK